VTARIARLAAAALVALLLALPAAVLPPAAAQARAADVSFGSPATRFYYGQSIAFTIPFTSTSPQQRMELRLRFPGSVGPFIIEVPVPPTGAQTLTHRLDLTGAGHLVPNTTMEATWAAVPAPGAEPVLSATETVRYQDTTKSWRSLKGDLVTVHWYEGSDAFARKALKIGEDAVRRTSALLGVTETDPIDFFIYADDASFRAALGPGTRENVGGQAHADIRTLFALITPDAINDPWVWIVIPHELTHLVFDTAVHNPYRFPPRWLNEGLAVYLSQGYTAGDRGLVDRAVKSRNLIPLTALAGQFPTDAAKTYLAYAESVSAIDYLVRTHGEPALLALVDAYKAGLTDDEAFTKALGRDLAAFQAGWLKDIGADAPQQFGPVANPPGPVPPGWDAPVPGFTPDPGGGASAASPGSSVSPGSSPASASPPAPDGTSTTASGLSGLIVPGIVALVLAVVVIGLVLARRRTVVP
jgi:hypothetical protein